MANLTINNEQHELDVTDNMPLLWVIRIDSDGTVTIVNNRSEMGQGIRTSLVMVGADELGADRQETWFWRARQQSPGA